MMRYTIFVPEVHRPGIGVRPVCSCDCFIDTWGLPEASFFCLFVLHTGNTDGSKDSWPPRAQDEWGRKRSGCSHACLSKLQDIVGNPEHGWAEKLWGGAGWRAGGDGWVQLVRWCRWRGGALPAQEAACGDAQRQGSMWRDQWQAPNV